MYCYSKSAVLVCLFIACSQSIWIIRKGKVNLDVINGFNLNCWIFDLYFYGEAKGRGKNVRAPKATLAADFQCLCGLSAKHQTPKPIQNAKMNGNMNIYTKNVQMVAHKQIYGIKYMRKTLIWLAIRYRLWKLCN